MLKSLFHIFLMLLFSILDNINVKLRYDYLKVNCYLFVILSNFLELIIYVILRDVRFRLPISDHKLFMVKYFGILYITIFSQKII